MGPTTKQIVLTIILIFCLFKSNLCEKQCQKEDLKYAYTECSGNTRWRVQIPKTDCTASTVEFPSSGLRCNVTCKPGNYLDIRSDGCKPCPAGQYSLGSGVRFNIWNELPPGFSVEARPTGSNNASCEKSAWTPLGSIIAAWVSPNCQLILTFTARLDTAGEVTFDYQFRSNGILFKFEAQNDRCERVDQQSQKGPWLSETESGEIGSKIVKLHSGQNVLQWTILAPETEDHTAQPVVLLQSVQITGLPYVRRCSQCPPGWYSSTGQASCTRCKRNEFSKTGLNCEPCPATQYSSPGSASCSQRPACDAKRDLEIFYGECRQVEKRLEMAAETRWVRPSICQPPQQQQQQQQPQAAIDCSSYCNPGMSKIPNSAKPNCTACPEGQFSSDTVGQCKQCPAGTQVVHEYSVTNWMVQPPMMEFSCWPMRPDQAEACPDRGWSLMGNYTRTSSSRLFAHRILNLKFPGFVSPDSDVYAENKLVSEFQIEFMTQCRMDCALAILQRSAGNEHGMLKQWKNSQPRQKFKFSIRGTSGTSLLLLFEPTVSHNETERQLAMHDHIKVFSIRTANVKGSGGVKCRRCPMGLKDDKCLPCMPGKYYDTTNRTCMSCPNNTIVSQLHAEGRNSCTTCPPGLEAVHGVACHIRAQPLDNSSSSSSSLMNVASRQFDLRPLLTGGHAVAGVKNFAYSGMAYMHLFNVSLNDSALAVCQSNASVGDDSLEMDRNSRAESFICKSTLVPSHSGHNRQDSVLARSLLDTLLNVSSSSEVPHMQQRLQQLGWPADSDNYDRHAFLESASIVGACKRKRTAVVTIRCDPSAAETQLQLPPKCPQATCDGCSFHFMLLSRNACPLCRRQDYDRILGECVLGSQVVHLVPPSHCYTTGSKAVKLTQTKTCPLIGWLMMAILCGAFGIVLASVLLTCYCYKQNKTLQYKYTQLAEANEGDLPAAESCAVNEGEDEDEEVSVKQGKAVFSKLRRSLMPSGASGGGRGGGEQRLRLTDQMEDLEL